MTNLSTILIDSPEILEPLPIQTNNEYKQDVCLISDSSNYIVRVKLVYAYLLYS